MSLSERALSFFIKTASAADPNAKLDQIGRKIYGSGANLEEKGDLLATIGNLIAVALGLVGVVFLVLMVYGGALWMTARGDEKMVTRAKDTITRNVIGLIIVLASYAITAFVFSRLLR